VLVSSLSEQDVCVRSEDDDQGDMTFSGPRPHMTRDKERVVALYSPKQEAGLW